MSQLNELFQNVTRQIIQNLQQGIKPWSKPWSTGPAQLPLRNNGVPYKGINILILWCQAMEKGYSSPLWLTFNQAKALSATIKKGEKSTTIVYASSFTKHEKDDQGEEVDVKVPFLKTYRVFNAEQVIDLPDSYYSNEIREIPDRDDQIDAFIQETGAQINHGGLRAFYTPLLDYIQMPNLQDFKDTEAYYGTLLHELTHWTGHHSRLNRFNKLTGQRDADYAFEELVAELGSAFLSAQFQIASEPRRDHADYIGSWLKLLENDEKAIFRAAALAQNAVSYFEIFKITSKA